MKTSFNSQSVRNEIFNIETETISEFKLSKKPIDKGVIALIAFFTVLITTAIVISSLGLTSNAY